MLFMSTENSSDQLFDNSVKILTDLISFKTISGEDNSSLINYCDKILKNEDCIEEDILKVKDYISFSIDQRLEETVSLLKKRSSINFFIV